MNFEDFWRDISSDRIAYDIANDTFHFRGNTYVRVDGGDDLDYLDNPIHQQIDELMRDLKREAKTDDIDDIEELVWNTMKAIQAFKKKLP